MVIALVAIARKTSRGLFQPGLDDNHYGQTVGRCETDLLERQGNTEGYNMKMIRRMRGITLVELMITVGILAIVSAIAIPAYKGYVKASRQTEGWNNLRTLQVAEEEYFLENNAYFAGATAAALNAASGGLWSRAEAAADANFEYSVNVVGTTYTATATGQNNLDNTVVLTVVKN